ncbi:MAG: hypothetical protein HN348_25870, partial [Proteobacteria bacterium]|nr:hypothetical protein [Pseudomonadota bacterium]
MKDNKPSHTAAKMGHITIFLASHPTCGPLLPAGVGTISQAILSGAGVLEASGFELAQPLDFVTRYLEPVGIEEELAVAERFA